MKLSNVIVDSIKTMKDGSLKINLVTEEITSEEKAQLFDLHMGSCDVTLENTTFLTQ